VDAGPLKDVAVLVVEDHPDLRELERFWLERAGAVVREASDGVEALVVLAARPPPDVIVCDLHMPVMDGGTFVARLRDDARYRHIPVIALTGSATNRALIETLEAGFSAHLVKPVTDETLRAQIHRVLVR